MQDRLPPENVILCHIVSLMRCEYRQGEIAHRCEYTPGMRASSKVCGAGCSHRSGFHSYASGPQSARLQLLAWMLARTHAPVGTGSEFMSEPSFATTGLRSGSDMSLEALLIRQ